MDYHRHYGVDVRVARIFNTYGPGMHPFDGRVVSNFIVQAITGEDLTVYGDGQQTRSFCYVDDLVEGMLAFMKQDVHTGPMNLGNPAELPVQELAEQILELTQSESKIVQCPLPGNDPKKRRPDTTRAQEYINWSPQVRLREGLIETIRYFRSLDLSKFHRLTRNTDRPLQS